MMSMIEAVAALLLLSLTGVICGCGKPPDIENAWYSVSFKTSQLSVATYTCNAKEGYVPKGNNTLPCFSMFGYSSWAVADMDFSCERVNCTSQPQAIDNSSSTFYTEEVITKTKEYDCSRYRRYEYDYGYNSNGCRERLINTTELVAGTFWYTNKVKHVCDPGFISTEGKDSIERECQSDGSWSATNHSCIPRDCGVPPSDLGMICMATETTYNSSADCECLQGFKRAGIGNSSFSAKCDQKGSWIQTDNAEFKCERINCGEPPIIFNSVKGSPIKSGTLFEDTAVYDCTPGYHTSINATITCQADKTWTATPACIRMDCGKPPEIDHGVVSHFVRDTKYEATVAYTCDNGYVIHNSIDTIRCGENGAWSSAPVCRKIWCGPAPSIQGGERSSHEQYFGAVVEYTCNFGHIMDGNSVGKCQEDGHWSSAPECHAIKCGQPPAINFGVIYDFTGVLYGQKVIYKCKEGYQFHGSLDYVVCQFNGQWTDAPECYSAQGKTL